MPQAKQILGEMKGEKSLAEILREETSLARQRLLEEKSAIERKDHEKDIKLQEAERKNAQDLFEEAKKQMKIAASNGLSRISLPVMSTDKEEYPRWATLRAIFTRDMPQAEGLIVEIKHNKLEPENSARPLVHTMYYITLEVSW